MALDWGFDGCNAGWVDAPDLVAECASRNEFLDWGSTEAATLDVESLPDEMLSLTNEIKVLGKRIDVRDQGEFGFCCGFGTVGAAERTLIARIAKGDSFAYKKSAPEVNYAGGRYDAGYRWMGDGSTAAASAAFIKNKGLCYRDIYGSYDLTEYQANAARGWARAGLPEPVLTAAKQFPCEAIAKITTWAQAKQAMAQGHYITVASSFGFKQTRDTDGVLTAWGRWLHCMLLAGWVKIKGEDHAHLVNSWGKYFKGPQGKYPIGDDGGYIHWKVAEAMLAQKDSYAIIGTAGAKLDKRLLNWGGD